MILPGGSVYGPKGVTYKQRSSLPGCCNSEGRRITICITDLSVHRGRASISNITKKSGKRGHLERICARASNEYIAEHIYKIDRPFLRTEPQYAC